MTTTDDNNTQEARSVQRMVMRLYVWTEVLTDYTDGMVAVLAHDEAEAWKLLHDADHTAWWVLRGSPDDREDGRPPEQLEASHRPRMVETPEAFVCWGGG